MGLAAAPAFCASHAAVTLSRVIYRGIDELKVSTQMVLMAGKYFMQGEWANLSEKKVGP